MKTINDIKSSGLALHYIKHKGGPEINGLQRNNERVPGQNHSNKHIDDSRTKNNIVLKKCDGTFYKTINQIIEDNRTTKHKIRKDAVKMVEATVQFSGTILTLPEKEQEQVLRDSYDWLKNEFGEENIVSAVIHKDETTMHLHFDFVPMKDGRLIAKEVICRGTLFKQQADFLKYQQDKHPDAYFERNGGDFKGLRQKDYEKVQAILKANEDEMKQYKKDLDDRSDKLDVREKKLNQKAKNYLKKSLS